MKEVKRKWEGELFKDNANKTKNLVHINAMSQRIIKFGG